MSVAVHNPCAPRITVAIADDLPVMREGLARLIADECDLAVSGSAATGTELRELVSRQPPRVLVMDLTFRDGEGLALIKDITELAPALPIVIYTLQPANIYAARCVRAGAHAYVMKHEAVATLFRAIRDLAVGGIAITSRVGRTEANDSHPAAPTSTGITAKLTDRELQVFRLVGLATPTRAIAEKLGVSVKTVETHRENIKNKLDVHSHGELLACAALWLRENGAA